MAKLQQAEDQAQKDRVQARREIDAHKKNASNLEHRYNQIQVWILLPNINSMHGCMHGKHFDVCNKGTNASSLVLNLCLQMDQVLRPVIICIWMTSDPGVIVQDDDDKNRSTYEMK